MGPDPSKLAALDAFASDPTAAPPAPPPELPPVECQACGSIIDPVTGEVVVEAGAAPPL